LTAQNTCFFIGGGGQRPLVPLLLLGLPFFSDYSFWSTTLLTGMTGNSLHMQWPLTSQLTAYKTHVTKANYKISKTEPVDGDYGAPVAVGGNAVRAVAVAHVRGAVIARLTKLYNLTYVILHRYSYTCNLTYVILHMQYHICNLTHAILHM
jgi:hypothetical protein